MEIGQNKKIYKKRWQRTIIKTYIDEDTHTQTHTEKSSKKH